MTTTPNYAEALEEEAYQLARQKLALAAQRTRSTKAELDDWLARLDAIHADNMAAAAAWAPPVTKLPPLTPTNVSDGLVHSVAISRVAEVKQES